MVKTMQVNGELVTWRRVLLLMASCIAVPITVSVTAGSFMLEKHEGQPKHAGAVATETFTQLDSRIKEMQTDIREIRSVLMEVSKRVQ